MHAYLEEVQSNS